MPTCLEIKVCLAEGASNQCIMLEDNPNDCPPCVYAITGGGYSCYTKKTELCPFGPETVLCLKNDTTSTPPPESDDSTPKPTTPTEPQYQTPTPDTPTPDPHSNTPTPETPTPETQTPETTDFTNTDPSNYSKSIPPGAPSSAYSTTLDRSDAAQSEETPLNGTPNGPAPAVVLSNTTATSSPSNMVASLALVGGAAVLVVIVVVFVARRAAKKKEKVKKLDHTASMGDSHRSNRTLSSGASSANVYSTYRYKVGDDNGNGISMLTDSRGSSAYGPDYADQAIHSGPSSRPMADFSNFGEPQFVENSRFYSGMGGSGQQHYISNSEMPTPLTHGGSHFVNVTSSLESNRSIGLDSPRSGEHPLTVSQLMPTAAVGGYDEEVYDTRQQAGSLVYGHVPPRAFDSAVSQGNGQFGVSTASSMRSDYDIVDPVTMRQVDARNTEMLAEANCYPKFSFESEADIYDGDSSEDESSDDEQLRHVIEHTI